MLFAEIGLPWWVWGWIIAFAIGWPLLQLLKALSGPTAKALGGSFAEGFFGGRR